MNDLQRGHIKKFKSAIVEAIANEGFEEVKPPLQHYHTPDLYGRRIVVPAGTIFVTKIHKSEHISVALRGHCSIVDEKGRRHEVIAPAVFITKPGTHRIVYTHDEVEWLTVHHCEAQDLDEIESILTCQSDEEYVKWLESEAGIIALSKLEG